MKLGARQTDWHTCPLLQPAAHVGGPITSPCAGTVYLEHLKGSVAGDLCPCACAADATLEATASTTVFYENKAAVRQGDLTAHGGVITGGAAHVYVGD